MPDDLNLPEPTTLDVWGTQLNAAIETLNVEVEGNTDHIAAIEAALGDGVDTSGFVTTSRIGAANGVASLDAGRAIPKSQLGNISPIDIGAADRSHSHSLSDLPAVSLALNSTPAIAVFNEVTDQWPTRAGITTSQTRTVIWWGDADIPTDAVPGVDIFFGPKTSGSTVPDPDPEPPADTDPDANGVALSLPVVVVTGSNYAITGSATTTTSKLFTFLQFAVRGPNGEEQDTGFNNNYTINNTTFNMTGSGSASAVGDWTVRIAYSLNGTTWVDGPIRTFTIASTGGVPTTPGALPVLGLSGKTWNSGVCDASNANISECNAFFAYRGAAGDAIMAFPGRESYDALSWLPDGLTTWPGYRVMAVSSQPESLNNSSAANATRTAHWTQYGLNLKNKGWDDGRTILRINWEANGNWYAWSWDRGGGAAAYVAAVKDVVNSVRIHAPNTKFNVCLNRGSVGGGVNWKTQIMDPLIGWVDIVGLDNYDFSPPSLNHSQFVSMSNIDPGMESVAAYCRLNSLKMSFDEWGVCTSVGGFAGGGDNPLYINEMYDWMAANSDVLRMDMYFNINADGLNQRLHPASENSKPNSRIAYANKF